MLAEGTDRVLLKSIVQGGGYHKTVFFKIRDTSVGSLDMFQDFFSLLPHLNEKVICYAFGAGLAAVIDYQGQKGKRICSRGIEKIIFLHLAQDHITPCPGVFRIPARVIVGIGLQHSHQNRRFPDGKIDGGLVEEPG